jgi:diadenosine tetraphosphatase ApaH/serine/threonine PP2A family protein phosphatase
MVPDVSGEKDTNRNARTIVIGDVHGCVDELQDLLRRCSIDKAADRVVLVGDLVAKGPDSQGVVQLVRERGFAAVLGNHDAKVLSIGRDSAHATADERGKGDHAAVARSLEPDDWRYLEDLPLYRELPDLDVIVVHAGLVPGIPLTEQPKNLLINMRSITPSGEPSKRVEAGVPWASLWPGPAHVMFGHDAIRGLQRHPFATGLDTGCVYGRALTACILPEHSLVSVPARRAYAPI